MCGIAGLIHRDGSGEIGSEMTSMLQALKHRGPDSAGFALYGEPRNGDYTLRFKVAEQEDMAHRKPSSSTISPLTLYSMTAGCL